MDESRPPAAPYAVVVDDNAVILLHAADILTDAGFSVFATGASDEALGWLEARGDGIVLLFTNVEIPGPMNGFGLARYAAEKWPNVAVLVSSGRFEPKPGDMPADAIFLAKPFSENDVLSGVRRALSIKRPVLVSQLVI